MRLIITVQNSNVEDLTYAWLGEFLWSYVLLSVSMCAMLIYARSAEITSGIICSCFPILPSFVRYFYGKATSKRRNENSDLFTYRDSSTQSPAVITFSNLWNDPDDSRLQQRSYLELQERSYWDSWDVEGAPEAPETMTANTTKKRAGEYLETITPPAPIRRSMKDMEHDGMHSGSSRTVTIAQYPKPVATVH